MLPRLTYSLSLGVGALALLLAGCQQPLAKKAEPPPQVVLFVRPVHQTVPEYEEFTGRAWASNTVQVRARVSGYLDKVEFTDGTEVQEKQLLAKIDDRPFKLAVIQAEAALRMTNARINRVKKQITRAENLIQTGSFTEEEFETLLSERNQAEASRDAAQAALDVTKLNEEFTSVTAPMKGRISRRLVDRGNLVTADETVLATIAADNPINVYFDMDERTVLRINRLIREGRLVRNEQDKVAVDIALADETDFKHPGEVDFVDNQLDPSTGTLRYRAEVKNEDRFIKPGMFVRLRFPIGEPEEAILVPEEAIATDQGQHSIFVINDEDKVESRTVTLGVLYNGMRVIANDGVKENERVVVSGLQRIRNGSKVAPDDRDKKPSEKKVAQHEK